MHELVQACAREHDAILALITKLASVESPSDDANALERCASELVAVLTAAGGDVERISGGGLAAHICARWPGRGSRVLVLGHFDTVYPIGQLARQPVSVRDGCLFGPGVYDMKGGLAIGITALRVLQAPSRPTVTMLVTSDEEIGSSSSRATIEALAREHDAVLVLEPPLANGAIKTARKGVGEYEIVVTGVPSHAGVDPESGASAIHELARVVQAAEALADSAHGLTVNVGVIEGGTRPNVVAERARALVDVRVTRIEDVERIDRALRALRPRDARVSIEVGGGMNRPPMERRPGVARLFELARGVAAEHGWTLLEGSTGGGSDGNFTGALGVPTLDGLGAAGDGAHSRHEHIVIKELVPRTAVLAGLLMRLADNRFRSD